MEIAFEFVESARIVIPRAIACRMNVVVTHPARGARVAPQSGAVCLWHLADLGSAI